jgi:hypothetical protein
VVGISDFASVLKALQNTTIFKALALLANFKAPALRLYVYFDMYVTMDLDIKL